MKNKIFIHVGAGKTGTSALQQFFHLNRELLIEKHIVLPEAGLSSQNHGLQHHRLSNHGPHKNKQVGKLWRDISLLKEQNLLLSSEGFHSKISEPDGLEYFKKVRDILSGKDIKIIFYLRRHSQWLQSAYSQFVKSNIQSMRMSDFLIRYKKNPVDQIFLFAEVFGSENIVVRPFEFNQFYEGSICKDFCNAIELTWDDRFVEPNENPNPRFLSDALEIKRNLNYFVDHPKELRHIKEDLLEYSRLANVDSSNLLFYSHSLMPYEDQVRIERENEPKYQKIARDFMGRDDGVLFTGGIPTRPTSVEEPRNHFINTDTATAFLIMKLYKEVYELKRENIELRNITSRIVS